MTAPPGCGRPATCSPISLLVRLLRKKFAGLWAELEPFCSPPTAGRTGPQSIRPSTRIWAAFAHQTPSRPPSGILPTQKSLRLPTAALRGSPPRHNDHYSLYRSSLRSLRPLVKERGELQPRFMRSEVPARNSSRPVLMEKASSRLRRERMKSSETEHIAQWLAVIAT